jgi:hypothetical protein
MSISWTKKFSAADDNELILTGTHLGTMQDDITAGTSGAVPTPGTSDALKMVRVKSDHSGYELITQAAMAAGGTGADLSAGTAGYAVVSQGTAGNMTLAPLYHTISATLLSDSAAQTIYCISPVTGIVTAGYVCGYDAARGATYTVRLGSAGVTIASASVPTSGVAGAVSTMVLGTVAVTAGASLSVARTAQGTTGAAIVSLVIIKTP